MFTRFTRFTSIKLIVVNLVNVFRLSRSHLDQAPLPGALQGAGQADTDSDLVFELIVAIAKVAKQLPQPCLLASLGTVAEVKVPFLLAAAKPIEIRHSELLVLVPELCTAGCT